MAAPSGPPVKPGVAYPNSGGRAQSIANNLGAPRGGKGAPKPPKGGKQPANKPWQGWGGPAKAAGPPKSPFYGGEIPNYGGVSRLARQEVGAPIHAQQVSEEGNIRNVFGAKNAESNYTEGQIANRLNTMNQGTQSYLQGLVAGSEGSAKTAQNYAAEAAQRSVETAGQNAQTNIGGIVPQAQGAVERNEANTQALRQIAAATAARGQEFQGQNKARFMTEEARNRTAENTALGKVGERVGKERLEAGQKLYTDILAKGKLEQTGQLGAAKVAQGQEKIAQGNVKNQLTLRGQISKRQETEERVAATKRGQTLADYRAEIGAAQRENASKRTRATGEERNRNQGRANEIRQGQYEEQDRIARERLYSKGASPAQNKLRGELGSAYGSVGLLRSGQKKANEGTQPAQIRQFLSNGLSIKQGKNTIKISKVGNSVIQTAAIELWYHPNKISSTTISELGQMGINLGEIKTALGI